MYEPLEGLQGFAVKNTENDTYLKRNNGKQVFSSTGAAKNAWNAEHRSERNIFEHKCRMGEIDSTEDPPECVRFNLQTKYVIVRLIMEESSE
tara:strand:+ start:4 stop:279 length:276 start_codon:yes stop_codon:yes gene_type:complete